MLASKAVEAIPRILAPFTKKNGGGAPQGRTDLPADEGKGRERRHEENAEFITLLNGKVLQGLTQVYPAAVSFSFAQNFGLTFGPAVLKDKNLLTAQMNMSKPS